MFRRRREETYRTLHRLISRQLLAPRNLAILFLCTVLNIVRNDWLTTQRIHLGIPAPVHPLAITVLYCVDFFTFGLIILAAAAFGRARRDGIFSELRLAGASWRDILLPLRDTIIALTLASAILEIGARFVLSYEATAFKAQEAGIMGLLNLSTAWFFALVILLMNVLRVWAPMQILVYIVVCLGVLVLPYFFMERLFDLFFDLATGRPNHPLVLAFMFPGSTRFQVASTLALAVMVLGVSAILFFLTPLLGLVARWRAERLVSQ